MSTTPGEAEKKSRKMASQVPDAGKEYQAYQEGQAELMGIEAQRKQLLMEQQIQNRSTAEKNAIVAQAAELGAMSAVQGGNGPVVAQQVSKMNPQTQAMLSKYGVGQPKVQLQQGRDVKVTPNHINITNNNVQKTTNNVTVQGNPAGSAPVVMKSAGDNGGAGTMAKFKTWMSNVFNRQKEEASIREKEYQRKEWSLSRSSGRVMRSLEKLGKTIGERLDPRKLASSNFSTMKALMWMVGLNRLVEWWPDILKFSRKAEGWFEEAKKFFGFGLKENEQSGLSKTIVSILGGDPSEKPGQAFKKFWWNETSDRRGMGLFNLLLAEIKHLFNFDLRAKAAGEVKFPKMETGGWVSDKLLGPLMNGLGGLMNNLGTYFKDVLTAFFTGKTPPPPETLQPIKDNALQSATDKNSSFANKNGKSFHESVDGLKDTSYGDAAVIFKNGQNWLEKKDLREDGQLSDNLGSSLRQGKQISSLLADRSNLHTAKIIEGLSRLENKIGETGETVVPGDFFDNVERIGLDPKKYKSQVQVKNFKFIREKNTDKPSWGEIADQDVSASGAVLADLGVRLIPGVGPLLASTSGTSQSAHEELSKELGMWKNKFKMEDYNLKLVPEDFEGEAIKVAGKTSFPLYVLDYKVLSEIKKDLSQKGNIGSFEFNLKDTESVEALNNILKGTKENNGIIPSDDLNEDYHKHAIAVQQQISQRKADREELNEIWKESRPGRGTQYVSGKVSSAIDTFKTKVIQPIASGSIGTAIKDGWNNVKDWVSSSLSGSTNPRAREAVVETASSYLTGNMKPGSGSLKYSQNVRDITKGSTDCSGFVSQIYKARTGLDIGTNSLSIMNNDEGIWVDKTSINKDGRTGGGERPNFNNIHPGDLMFYARPDSTATEGRPYRVGHVAMYIGNGKEISMGGTGGKGPYVVSSGSNGYIGAKSFLGTNNIEHYGEDINYYDDEWALPRVDHEGKVISKEEWDKRREVNNNYKKLVNINTTQDNSSNWEGVPYKLSENNQQTVTTSEIDIDKINNEVSSELGKNQITSNADYISKRLQDELGLSDQQSAGVLGFLYGESGLDHTALNKKTGDSGLAQWNKAAGRQGQFVEKYGHKPHEGTLEENVDFMISEMKSPTYKTFLKEIKETSTAAEAARVTVGRYGFLAGWDKAVDSLIKHNGNNHEAVLKNLAKRQSFASQYVGEDTSSISLNNSSGESFGESGTSSSTDSSSSGKGFFSEVFDIIKTGANNLWNGVKEGIENIGRDPEAEFNNVGFDESLRRAKELSEKLGIPLPGEDNTSVLKFLRKHDKDFIWQRRTDNDGNETMWAQVSHIGRVLNGDENYEDYKTLLEKGIDPGKDRYEEREKKRLAKLNKKSNIETPDNIEKENRSEDLEVSVTKNEAEFSKVSPDSKPIFTPTLNEVVKDYNLLDGPQFSKDPWTNDFLAKSLERYESLQASKESEKDILIESRDYLKQLNTGFDILSGGLHDLARVVSASGNNIINVSQSGGPTVHKSLT